MIRYSITLLLFVFQIFVAKATTLSIVSWNPFDFGKTKSDEEILTICKLVKDFDIVAIQEVVALDPGGAQAVARMADQLNRMGAKWDYSISNPTNCEGKFKERYAFIWKTSKVKKRGENFFDTSFEEEIKREPFLGRFQTNNKEFLLMNFHAISKNAASEVEYIPTIISKYPNDRLIIAADFNVADSHPTMKSIYSMGFSPALINQKTTLKETLGDNGDYLFASKDNIVVMDDYFEIVESGIINIMKHLGDLNTARNISDHVGIWVKVTFKE